MQRLSRITLLLCLALCVASACSDSSTESAKAPGANAKTPDYGSVRIRNVAMDNTDISGILYDVACDDGTTISKYVELEDQTLPEHLGGGNGERFADFFEVLPATDCQITATAMLAEDTPAPGCEPAVDTMTVVPGETVEVVLPIVCGGNTGAVDIVTVIGSGGGNGLTITAGTFGPSKFITRCQSGVFTIEVEGGDGNYSYSWDIIDSPPASFPQLVLDDNRMAIRTDVAGEYKVRVTVTDGEGNSASLEFPVHVGADGIYEDCEDVCCTLPGENGALDAYITTLPSACEAAGGQPEELQLGQESVCDSEVCCKTANGIETVSATACPAGQRVDEEQCVQDLVCCSGTHENGYTVAIVVSAEECEQLAQQEPQANISVVPQRLCFEEVCCEGDNGVLAVRPLSECEFDSFAPQPPAACTDNNVCCVDGDIQSVVPGSECQGTSYAVEACENTVCCATPDGEFGTQVDSYCQDPLGGTIVDPDLCATVCCQLDPQGPSITTRGYCEANGTVGNADDCQEIPDKSHTWRNTEDMDPDVQCSDTPYLVVPSTGDNKAVVYDLNTLDPLPTSPFNTCLSPSRVLMDANTDVYIACRGATLVTQLNKHTRDGQVLWQSNLAGCSASRAVTMNASGRLFAGCTNTNRLHELDASTGQLLNNTSIPGQIYGAWATSNGVWTSGGSSYTISYVELTPTPQVKFTLNLTQTIGDFNPEREIWRPYGVTADAEGNGWFAIFSVPVSGGLGNHRASESRAIKVDPNGNITVYELNSIDWNTTGLARGIQVGLDGLVRIAVNTYIGDTNGPGGLIVLDPSTGVDQYFAANQAGSTPTQPDPGANFVIGVTSDANNNTYTVDRTGQRVIRVAPDGTQTPFGRKPDANGNYQQILVSPYGYSGDMTGLATTCISGATQEISGDIIDSGAVGTTWNTISWTAMEPAGTSVRVFYRIQGTTQWIEATNGGPINGSGAGANNLVGRQLELKAILGTTVAPTVPTLNNVTVSYQ